MKNTKGLGRYQKHMLGFLTRYPDRFHHIARDSQTRNVALSLEKRGLLNITNKAYTCWVVRLAK